MTENELCSLAYRASQSAYAPYSGFFVGAALLASSGKVYTGFNIENASLTPTVCAERVAIFKAISEGERSFSAIAICGGKGGNPAKACPPCGVCRQVLIEFCSPSLKVYLANSPDSHISLTLGDLLPFSFSLDDIQP